MGAHSRVNSRDELKDYALRAIGAPVLKINVDDEQLEDRINDALDMFWEYHADGSQRVFVKHQLTQENFDERRVMLPKNVISVLRVLPVDGAGIYPTTNLQYVMYMTDIMDVRRFNGEGMSSYAVTMSYLNLIQDMFNPEKVVGFNMHKNFLTIDTDWTLMSVGDWLLVECYVIVDPDEYAEVWNNKWLREYTAALFKKQWGVNLIKYSGEQLSGGVTVNGEKIYDDAVNEVKELEERLRNEYQYPVDFFVG